MMTSTRLSLFSKSLLRHLVPLLAIAVGLTSRTHGAPVSLESHANVMVEIPFEAGSAHDDPFNTVSLDVVFTMPNNKTLRVPAFWAGGDKWKVRYASPMIGTHQFISECSDAHDKGLHNVTGNVRINAYAGDNPFYKHGPIQVAADRRHLQHADGTPFFWLADTWWMGLTKRLGWPEDFKTLAADRREKGFNVVQIVAGLYPDMPAFDERGANEAGFPWTKDYGQINPAYFDAADRRIAWLANQGIAPCIVGAWGYHLPWLGIEKMKQHWRYIVARYGAYPTFWCVAGEGVMPYYLSKTKPQDSEFQKKGWTKVAAYLRSIDPYHHPVTIHPSDMSRHQVEDPSVLDFEMLQTGHGDRASIPGTLALVGASRAAQPRMPTINAEVCYEGILGTCHADVVRFMVWSCLLSGTAGHTYGANGIWQLNGRDKPYGNSPWGGGYGNTPWDEAMRLPGSQQAGFAKKLLQEFEWQRFEPHPDWAEYGSDKSTPPPTWGQWIWFPEGEPAVSSPVGKRYFRKSFNLSKAQPAAGALWLAADNQCTAYVNGKRVGARTGWNSASPIDITATLRPGKNVIAIEAENLPAAVTDNPAGLICSLRIQSANGPPLIINSDGSWRSAKTVADASPDWTRADFHDDQWPTALVLGPNGRSPWGKVSSDGATGPFTAGIPEQVRVIYVPESLPLKVLHLETNVKYHAQAFDPVSGTTKEMGPVVADERGSWAADKPPSDSDAEDWVLVLESAK